MSNWYIWVHIAINLVLLAFLIRITFRMALFVLGYRRTLPFVPTSQRSIKTIINSGALQDRKRIVDLGCGNGTMIAAFAKAYPDATFVGVESNGLLVWSARLRFLFWKKKPTIVKGDMFAYPVGDADAIVGFWISGFTERLLPKFERECAPGTVIVSNVFRLPSSEQFAEQQLLVGKRKVYIYRKQSVV